MTAELVEHEERDAPVAEVSRRRVAPGRWNHWARYSPDDFVRFPHAPRLSLLAETGLVRRAQAGDVAARNELWTHHLRLVLSVVNDFRIAEPILADALQEGAIGLTRAIEKYSTAFDASFTTYAWRWVYQAIQRFLTANVWLAPVPAYIFTDYMRFRRELRAAGTHADARAVFQRWRAGDRRTYLRVLAIHALARPRDLDDVAPEEVPVATDEPVAEEFDYRGAVADGLRALPEREREVLTLRYGLSGEPERCLREIGERMGISKERARQIQEVAEARLRRYFNLHGNAPFDTEEHDESDGE